MFADIEADVYIMADSDLTYDPESAPEMVGMILADQLDMVVGTRRHEAVKPIAAVTSLETGCHSAALRAVRA